MCLRNVSVIVLCALLLSVRAAAEEPSEAQRAAAVNQAGRLRMLSQKMCKEALQVVVGVDVEGSKAALAGSIALFERIHAGLSNGSAELGLAKPSAGAAAELAKCAPLLAAFKAQADQVCAGKADVAGLVAANAPLMKAAIAAVDFLADETRKATGKETGPVINVAGRQRMLSQRVARSFFLIAAKHQVDQAKQELAADLALFEKAQKGLIAGDAELGLPAAPDDEMKAQLDEVAKLFTGYRAVLEKALQGAEPAAADLEKVAELSVSLLVEANKATQMFELRAAGKN